MSVRVNITVKELREVNFPIAGNVRIEDFQVDTLKVNVDGAGKLVLVNVTAGSLDIELDGAGDITADGITDSLIVDISGVGSFKGGDLSVQTAQVTINGTGNATVWVAEDLTANINGVGSVSYYGSPQVHESIGGLGSVHKIGDK
jgi:hypothetical protein